MRKTNKIIGKHLGDTTSVRKLVLLHGLGASADQFSPLFELADHGVHLIAVTLPGHDRNVVENPDIDLGFESFRDMVIDLCDELEIRSAVICGISMGSAIALMIAEKRPDLCKSLVVARPAWLTEAQPKNLQLIGLIGELFVDHSADDVLALLEATPEFMEIAKDVPGAAESLRSSVLRENAEPHAPVLAAIYRDAPFRRLNELREIRCPVTVVGTNADPLHPIELARQTSNSLPNARLEVLPPRYLEPTAFDRAFRKVVGDALNLPDGDQI